MTNFMINNRTDTRKTVLTSMGKFPSFHIGLMKMRNFPKTPPAIMVDRAVFELSLILKNYELPGSVKVCF